MRKYTTLNLRNITRGLGDHYDPFIASEYTGYCKCGEQLTQQVDRCEVCDERVVWLYSKEWDQLFLFPETDLAIYLMEQVGTEKFKNGAQYHRWSEAVSTLSDSDVRRTIDYCVKQRKGRGTMAFTINTLHKKARKQGIREEKVGDNIL